MKIDANGMNRCVLELRDHCNAHIALEQGESIKITTDTEVGQNCIYINNVGGKFIIDGSDRLIWPTSHIRPISDDQSKTYPN